MFKDLVVGIDLGLKGGLAVLSEYGEVIDLRSMPTTTDPHGKNVVSVLEVDELFGTWAERIRGVVIEYTHAFGGAERLSSVGVFSFGRGTGHIEAVIALRNYPCLSVPPQTWKADVLVGTKRDKAAAIGWCLSAFPGVILKTKRGLWLDGLADALCIAEYGRRKLFKNN